MKYDGMNIGSAKISADGVVDMTFHRHASLFKDVQNMINTGVCEGLSIAPILAPSRPALTPPVLRPSVPSTSPPPNFERDIRGRGQWLGD